jgi:cbb3-type cytochrome oxidase maturation protein
MFYVWWIGFIAAGLWVSIGAFLWAIQSGQFSDQTRARYLPLRDEQFQQPVENPSRLSREVYVLFGVVVLDLIIIGYTLFLTFFR